MTATAGSIGQMTPAGVDALLTESTAVTGWADSSIWSWRRTPTTFELRGHLPPVEDPGHRELMVIGGASLLNLRVLTRVLGLHPAVQLLPDPTDPELIAIVRPEGVRVITSEDRLLAAGIVLSAAAGPPGGSAPPEANSPVMTEKLLRLLRQAAKVEHGWLAVISPDPSTVSIGRSAAESPGDATVAVVIGTVLDSAVTRLQAGQAMQRVLLTATVSGITAQPVPDGLTEPGSLAALRELIGGGL
ncbi:MAG: hypothetical protein ABJD68_12260, partial [Nakamurella sp.]